MRNSWGAEIKKLGIRDSGFEIRNPEFEIRNPEFEIRNPCRVLRKLERLVFPDFRSRRKPAAEPQVNQKARVNRPETVVNERRDFVNEPPFQFAWDTTESRPLASSHRIHGFHSAPRTHREPTPGDHSILAEPNDCDEAPHDDRAHDAASTSAVLPIGVDPNGTRLRCNLHIRLNLQKVRILAAWG